MSDKNGIMSDYKVGIININRGLNSSRGLNNSVRGLYDINQKKTKLKVFKRDDFYDDDEVKPSGKKDGDKETDVSIDNEEAPTSVVEEEKKKKKSKDKKPNFSTPIGKPPIKLETPRINPTSYGAAMGTQYRYTEPLVHRESLFDY